MAAEKPARELTAYRVLKFPTKPDPKTVIKLNDTPAPT